MEQPEAIFSGALSDLIIDADKNWGQFDITGIGKVNIREINTSAILELEGDHTTPTNGDTIGQIDFIDDDDAGTPNRDTYAQIRALIEDPTSAGEDAEMFLSVIKAATLTDYISLNEGNNDFVTIKKTLEFADAGNQLHTNSTGLFIDIANTDVLRIRDVTTELATIDEVNGLKMARRIQGIKGADVASADAPTLGDGNYFDITGTTTINHIQNTAWQAGSTVSLQFDGAVTLTHQAGTPAGDEADLFLAGAVNASMTADDVITLVFDGTNWRETARSVN